MNADEGRTSTSLGRIPADVARLGAFSDGVFAIAATLLALEIRFPELDESAVQSEFAGQVLDAAPSIVAFIFGFVIIGIYWIAHHRLFQLIERGDNRLLWLNLSFLLFVAFLPVPTSLIMRHPTEPVVMVFYLCSLIPVSLSQLLLWRHVSRDYRLIASTHSDDFVRYLSVRASIPIIASLISLVGFVIWGPAVFGFGMVMMVLYIALGRSRIAGA